MIGANDLINPVVRTDQASSSYGVPRLNVDLARNVIVVNRGNRGSSGIDNALFCRNNCLLYDGGQAALSGVIRGT